MYCHHCGHRNESGKFCVKCGTALSAPAGGRPLDGGTPGETAAAAESLGAPANEPLQQAKRISRQYFAYFGQVLRHPYQIAQHAGREQLANGVITTALLSLLFPLLAYASVSRIGFGHLSFGRIVLETTFYFLLIFALIHLVLYAVLRLGGVQTDLQGIAARFGTLLVPAALSIAAAIAATLLGFHANLVQLFTLFGVVCLFVSLTATLLSYRKEKGNGLDTLYGVVIANVASGYIFFWVTSFAVDSFGSRYFSFGW